MIYTIKEPTDTDLLWATSLVKLTWLISCAYGYDEEGKHLLLTIEPAFDWSGAPPTSKSWITECINRSAT